MLKDFTTDTSKGDRSEISRVTFITFFKYATNVSLLPPVGDSVTVNGGLKGQLGFHANYQHVLLRTMVVFGQGLGFVVAFKHPLE